MPEGDLPRGGRLSHTGSANRQRKPARAGEETHAREHTPADRASLRTMQVNRLMPTEEAHELIELTREICRKELAPRVDDAERERRFPAEAFTALGRAGLLSLPYPEEYGGAAQPYEVYLQVVEEIAATWMSVAVGVSVHALTCFPLAGYGLFCFHQSP